MPDTAPLTIFNFNAAAGPIDAPKTLATGSDADIGGLSTCELTAVSEGGESSSFSSSSSSDAPGSSSSSSPSHLSFHGNLSLHVPSKYAGRIRTGYAAFRNKSRPTLFGEETWDLGLYSHLKVEVAYRGLDAWRSRWVVNMQTDGPVR